mmetsp:Transcript_19531/g.39326  ORF Transcript_19531/g.39326 Transcript_19531/m.39326 type:complete len:100 (-) Transcript_19531:912-1211(-)
MKTNREMAEGLFFVVSVKCSHLSLSLSVGLESIFLSRSLFLSGFFACLLRKRKTNDRLEMTETETVQSEGGPEETKREAERKGWPLFFFLPASVSQREA